MKMLVLICFGLTSVLFSGSVAAESPRERLLTTVDSALNSLYGECCKNLPLTEKETKVRAVIEESFDLTVIIRRAFGRNWGQLSPAQQTEAVDLIKSLIVKAFVQNLTGQERPLVTLGETVSVTDKRIEIPTTIVVNDQNFYVLYRLGRMRSGWEIYDIVAENVSVVSNYRQQFDDHFRKGNGAQLIQKLKSLLTSEKLDETIQL